MKKLLFLACTCTLALNTQSQNIATVRTAALGTTVTVRGVVVNGGELGIIRYVQDNSAGIAAYGSTLTSVNRGDSILISGELKEFKNLLELDPIEGYTIIPNGHLPTPQVITPSQFGEAHEGELLKVLNCSFGTSGTFAANTNYTVTSNGQQLVVRTNTSSPIVGTSIPSGTTHIIGVGSQFCNTPTSGCTFGYQLLIRDASDLTTSHTSTVTTGVSKVEETASISVFPNPVTNNLNFKINKNEPVTSVTITDVSGRVVYSNDQATTTIDISGLAHGLYNLNVSTEKNNFQTKFVVE